MWTVLESQGAIFRLEWVWMVFHLAIWVKVNWDKDLDCLSYDVEYWDVQGEVGTKHKERLHCRKMEEILVHDLLKLRLLWRVHQSLDGRDSIMQENVVDLSLQYFWEWPLRTLGVSNPVGMSHAPLHDLFRCGHFKRPRLRICPFSCLAGAEMEISPLLTPEYHSLFLSHNRFHSMARIFFGHAVHSGK